jgi:valyl-tRNA synthetase
MDCERRETLTERTRYVPGDVEQRIFDRWLANDAFAADPAAPGEPYCICLPPPNVTGSLHMGHALNGAVQDLLIRMKRMQGRNVLWQPGTDHAGIATQMVVERELAREGVSRHDLGRDRFVERVWQWRAETGSTIIEQYKRLGSSMDYQRERFTMDAAYARAVADVFVRLHERGYIYRDNRLVNWSWPLRTAISDLEVDHRDVDDVLYHIRYDVEGGGDIVIATVRPVTILADTAVAVHPDDERYRHLIGRTAIVPLVNRHVPIIADTRVERDFGTGALKITPGHDPVDFDIGRDHNLAWLSFLREDGTLSDLRPDWEGATIADGHDRAVAGLRAEGRIEREQPYRHTVGFCSRSGERIEPLISLQWYCRMDELAANAIDAVRSGRVTFHPRRLEKVFFDWMEAIRPWCISRQLWWGHRLPVWFAADGSYTVAIDRPGGGCTQSEDVLDTWFSSALWPYATLGWPDFTAELARWYPGDVLVTARDIINLWVARMIFTGLEFAGDVPFTNVYINSTIQAADGRRMSKSLGTGVDPLELIDQYGADATRYGLLKMCSTQDVRFAEGMIDEGRAVANKLWNAARLLLLSAPADTPGTPDRTDTVDRWILTRLADTIRDVTSQYEQYAFSTAVKTLYSFIWNEFCDWYLEAIKSRLRSDDLAVRKAASQTALHVLGDILALTHPVMPFVTEEIWSYLNDDASLLMRAPFPSANSADQDRDAEHAVTLVISVVTELRRLRSDAGLPPRAPLALAIRGGRDADQLNQQAALVAALADTTPSDASGGVPAQFGDAQLQIGDAELATALRGRLEKRLATARNEHAKAETMLANPRLVERAPAQVVDELREREQRFGRDVAELERKLGELAGA